MSEEKNPYVEEIRKKFGEIYNKIYEVVAQSDIEFEECNVDWSYTKSGAAWMDLSRLTTWQFKDTIKKAYEWESSRKLQRVQSLARESKTDIEQAIKLQRELSCARDLYVRWDCVEDYYSFDKDSLRKVKKLRKFDTMTYNVPAYGNCFGKIKGPDACIVGRGETKLLIPITCIDLEKTFSNKDE